MIKKENEKRINHFGYERHEKKMFDKTKKERKVNVIHLQLNPPCIHKNFFPPQIKKKKCKYEMSTL